MGKHLQVLFDYSIVYCGTNCLACVLHSGSAICVQTCCGREEKSETQFDLRTVEKLIDI